MTGDPVRPVGSPLGGLAAPGPSKVGSSGAMRARDVSRPGPAELPEAEAAQPGSGGSTPERS